MGTVRRGILVGMALGLLAVPAAGLGASPDASSDASAVATEPWIAYQTDRGGEGTWLIHPDGTGDRQVAADFAGDLILPNWSPDGRRLVMTSRGTGGTEPLYEYDLTSETSNSSSTARTRVSGTTSRCTRRTARPWPSSVPWVPSRMRGHRPTAACGWAISHRRGPARHQATRAATGSTFPHWSPDGSQLTYWRWREDEGGTTGTAVFVIDADGTDERQFTEWEAMAGDADWSPDGEWIVYSSFPLQAFNSVPAVSNLYRMHPDGTGTEQLTFTWAVLRASDRASCGPDEHPCLAASGREACVVGLDGDDRCALLTEPRDDGVLEDVASEARSVAASRCMPGALGTGGSGRLPSAPTRHRLPVAVLVGRRHGHGISSARAR